MKQTIIIKGYSHLIEVMESIEGTKIRWGCVKGHASKATAKPTQGGGEKMKVELSRRELDLICECLSDRHYEFPQIENDEKLKEIYDLLNHLDQIR